MRWSRYPTLMQLASRANAAFDAPWRSPAAARSAGQGGMAAPAPEQTLMICLPPCATISGSSGRRTRRSGDHGCRAACTGALRSSSPSSSVLTCGPGRRRCSAAGRRPQRAWEASTAASSEAGSIRSIGCSNLGASGAHGPPRRSAGCRPAACRRDGEVGVPALALGLRAVIATRRPGDRRPQRRPHRDAAAGTR